MSTEIQLSICIGHRIKTASLKLFFLFARLISEHKNRHPIMLKGSVDSGLLKQEIEVQIEIIDKSIYH